MMLAEIERRQREFANKLKLERERAAAKRQAKKKRKELQVVTQPEVQTAPAQEETQTPVQPQSQGVLKVVAVAVPVQQHVRMEALIAKTKGIAGGVATKKEIMARALESYLNNFDKAETGHAALIAQTAENAASRLTAIFRAQKRGYVHVAMGEQELIVFHHTTTLIGDGVIPATFEGLPVRVQPDKNPVVAAYALNTRSVQA